MRDGTLGQLDRQEEADRLADPWRGARYVTFRGERVFLTAGQMERLAAALADRPPGQPLALTF